ncbi:D-alanyl-D-alanine carboxypeptidase [Streptomyces sp. NPDC001835]|uniref:D-alanyl-D-alanine carboxypeptidase n=1 Tax=Streptomyces sp. NPDC001835 TaxID=3154528 RepID=UPI0033183099
MEEASVAGESPDRSKQRESSAEPTSGSAGSVPEARDPRLAVSREKDSSGAVDTATKILSVRDAKAADDSDGSEPQKPGEDQDSDLREAVSAWIRSAKNPESESEAGSGTDDDADAAPESGADAETESEAGTGAAAAAGSGAKSGGEGGGKAATGSDTGSRPDADSDRKPATDAKGAADTGPDTEPGPDAGRDAGQKAGTGSTAKTAAGAAPKAATGSRTAATSAEPDAGPQAGQKADEDSDATKDADSDAKAATGSGKATADGGAKAAGGSRTGAASASADTGRKAGAGSNATADADGDAKTAGGSRTGTSASPDAGRKAGQKADEDSDATEDADGDAKAAAGSRTGAAPASPDTGRNADQKAGATADAGTAAKDATGSRTGATSADPDTGRKAGSGATADAGTAAKAGAGDGKASDGASGEAGAGDGAKGPGTAPTDAKAAKVAGAKAAAAAARAAKAAGGEDAPQGAPAAGDESRAGGKTPAEAKGVDQPTTAFKAVRPKKPEVDQPTTMLKLGTAKPKPETEAKGSTEPSAPAAERTSKFVPLRNSDLAAPTGAFPQVGPERTTQQPLPPKPPLDLLAELTNTPPPPETPVRTLVRRVKIWTPLVILLAIVFAVVQAMRPLPQPTLDLTAKDSYTFGGAKTDIPWPAQGQAALDVQGIGTFGSSGAQKPVPIASVAKVMTAYIILRDHPLKSGADGPKIKIDQAAQDQSKAGQESTVDVTAGDTISQREALESILIASANNVARLLARWDVGSEKEFVAKMNSTAGKLGMTNTTYTDPSGLTNSTVSTAVDQVKLAKAAMEEPAFREVAAMMSYDDYKGVNHSNWNHLVGHNNVVGIKTGTTTSALGNLVFAAKQEVGGETRTIVGAVVRQPAGGSDNTILSGALDAADKLIRSAQGALKSATVLKKGDVVGYVDDGLGGRTPVVATKDVAAAGWSGLKVKLSFTSDVVPHTAKTGTEVGTLTVGDGGAAGAVKVPVALQKDLTEPGFTDKLTRVG